MNQNSQQSDDPRLRGKPMPQIGGLDATHFINRRVKIKMRGGKDPQPSIGVMRELASDGKIVIEVNTAQGKQRFHVVAKFVYPFWAQNPDLKTLSEEKNPLEHGHVNNMAAAFENANQPPAPKETPVEEPVSLPAASALLEQAMAAEEPEPEPAPPPPEVVPEPLVEEEEEDLPISPSPVGLVHDPAPAANLKVKGIKAMVIHGTAWMADYTALLEAIKEDEDLERQRIEIERKLSENRGMIGMFVESLNGQGIELEWETEGTGEAILMTPVSAKFVDAALAYISSLQPTDSFTYDKMCEATNIPENAAGRKAIGRAATQLGWHSKRETYAGPFVFRFKGNEENT